MTHGGALGCERMRSSGGTNLLPARGVAPAPSLPVPAARGERSALTCATLSSAPWPGPGPCSTHLGPRAVPGCPPLPHGRRGFAAPRPLPPQPGPYLRELAGPHLAPPRAAGPQGLGGCRGHTAQTGPGCTVPVPPSPAELSEPGPCCHSLWQPCGEAGGLEPHRQVSSQHHSSRSTIHLQRVPCRLKQGWDRVLLPAFLLFLLIPKAQRL